MGSYAVCVDAGSMLLTQLWNRDPAAGRWTLPGGGMDFGEHPEQTVLRELYEETGLHGTVDRLLDIRSAVSPSWRDRDPLHVVQFVYRIEAAGDPRVIEENGSTIDVGWFPLSRIPELPVVGLVSAALELVG